MDAVGNVVAEGSQYLARGHRIAFSEEKNLLTLYGDARGPATLYRENPDTGQRDEIKAAEFKYSRYTQEVNIVRMQAGGVMIPQAEKTKKNPPK